MLFISTTKDFLSLANDFVTFTGYTYNLYTSITILYLYNTVRFEKTHIVLLTNKKNLTYQTTLFRNFPSTQHVSRPSPHSPRWTALFARSNNPLIKNKYPRLQTRKARGPTKKPRAQGNFVSSSTSYIHRDIKNKVYTHGAASANTYSRPSRTELHVLQNVYTLSLHNLARAGAQPIIGRL